MVDHEKDGPAHTWEISALGGRSFIIEKSKYVWVDTSATGGAASYLDPTKRVKAGAGPIIYQVAQAYARNTGKTFTPDPAGVSEIALPRRWAQILSSATRFGDVSHIDPYGTDGCELPG